MNNELNRLAMRNPQPGDYWHERFCPYFIVVQVKGDKITILSAIEYPNVKNARIDNDDYTWGFDASKYSIVDRQWVADRVQYNTIPGFVADVVRSEKTQAIVNDYIEYRAKELLKEFEELGPTASKYLIES